MARSAGTYFSGLITGTNNVEDFQTEIETRIKAFQSNGGDAWEEYDVVNATAGSRDVVFRSKGDRTLNSGAGDANLIMRVTQASTTSIRFRAYQDWSTLSSTGSREINSTSSTNGAFTTLSASTDIEFFGISNEYEFTMVIVQGGSYAWVSFGSPKRTHVPNAANGIALTTAAETAGSNVVVNLDRDISSNIAVGQKIWLQNVTATGNALESDTINIAEVTAVTSNSVTVDTLADNFASGALVGMDPSPMCCNTGTTTVGTMYFTTESDGTYTGVVNQSYDTEPLLEAVAENANDPNPNGLYIGCQALFDNAGTTSGGFRGTPEFMTFWSVGTQADQDRMIANFDNAQAYKVFPSIINASYALAVGPGAT